MPKEVIVVEGIRDAQAVRRAFPDADIMITHGWGLTQEQLKLLRLANERRGVIILTDPDYAGDQIRRRLETELPGCRHAFVSRTKASGDNRIGVEKASPGTIREAIDGVRTSSDWENPSYSVHDLTENGLAGGAWASRRRQQLGEILAIGYANGKNFLRRLNALGVPRAEFAEALEQLEDEDDGCDQARHD